MILTRWRNSAVGITTIYWLFWGQTPVHVRLSAPIQTDSGAHLASCTVGTGSSYWLAWGQTPVQVRLSAPIQTDSGAHLASCTVGTGSNSRRNAGGVCF